MMTETHRPRRRRSPRTAVVHEARAGDAHRPAGPSATSSGSCSCLVFGLPLLFMIVSQLQARPPDLRRPDQRSRRSSRSATSPWTTTPASSTGCRSRSFMMNSIMHLRRSPSCSGLIVNTWRRSPWPGSKFRGQRLILGDHPGHPDRAVRDAGAAAAVVGQQAAVLRRRQRLLRLAGHLPGADHAVHRQRLLDLPLLPVLRLHPEGAGRGRQASTGPAGSGSTAASSCRCPGRPSRPSRS